MSERVDALVVLAEALEGLPGRRARKARAVVEAARALLELNEQFPIYTPEECAERAKPLLNSVFDHLHETLAPRQRGLTRKSPVR
jgi:hypothetical protein